MSPISNLPSAPTSSHYILQQQTMRSIHIQQNNTENPKLQHKLYNQASQTLPFKYINLMRRTNRKSKDRPNELTQSNLSKAQSSPSPLTKPDSNRILPPFATRSRSQQSSNNSLSINNQSDNSLHSISRCSRSNSPMETLVTLHGQEGQPQHLDPTNQDVSLSAAAAKIIPAVFNLVPLETSSNSTQQPKRPAFTQAGGHQGSFRHDGAFLEKKVTEIEKMFYEDAQKGKWPTHLLPNYNGPTNDGTAIRIENLTYGYKRPCVMDLKMGVSTVTEHSASILKRLRMTALDIFTHSKSAGCRLEGLSMYRTLENRRIKGTKAQSHSLSALVNVTLQDVLTFFLTDESGVRTDIALRFQQALEGILEQFEKNTQYKFIGSSILLVYDNDNNEPYMHWSRALRKLHQIKPGLHLSDDQISGLTRRTKVQVRMIDFAHTGPLPAGQEKDEGYITGLHTVINALGVIRKHRSKPIFSIVSAAVDLMEEHRANARASNEETPAFTFDTVLSELTALSKKSDEVITISDNDEKDEQVKSQQS